MNVCLGMCIYYVCMCILCIWVYSVCMHVCTCIYVVCVCMRMYVHVSSCVWLRDTAFQINSYDPNSITENLDCVRYKLDTQVIRRPTHEMIRRSVPARIVKTKWRFRSETASFHVSVCSCIIFLFIIASRCQCIYSYYFMWSSNLFCQYDYLYYFMRYQWTSTLIMQLIWVFIGVISYVSNSSLLAYT